MLSLSLRQDVGAAGAGVVKLEGIIVRTRSPTATAGSVVVPGDVRPVWRHKRFQADRFVAAAG